MAGVGSGWWLTRWGPTRSPRWWLDGREFLTRLGRDDKQRLMGLGERLHQWVVGLEEAFSAVAEAALRHSRWTWGCVEEALSMKKVKFSNKEDEADDKRLRNSHHSN